MIDVFTKVTCELPFEVIGQSSSEISVQMDGNGSSTERRKDENSR